MKPLVTKVQAELQGLRRYFTGKPCRRGHVSERWVANYNCIACALGKVEQNRARKRRWRDRQRPGA